MLTLTQKLHFKKLTGKVMYSMEHKISKTVNVHHQVTEQN